MEKSGEEYLESCRDAVKEVLISSKKGEISKEELSEFLKGDMAHDAFQKKDSRCARS